MQFLFQITYFLSSHSGAILPKWANLLEIYLFFLMFGLNVLFLAQRRHFASLDCPYKPQHNFGCCRNRTKLTFSHKKKLITQNKHFWKFSDILNDKNDITWAMSHICQKLFDSGQFFKKKYIIIFKNGEKSNKSIFKQFQYRAPLSSYRPKNLILDHIKCKWVVANLIYHLNMKSQNVKDSF